jgi:hypothetical protein
MRQNNLLGEYLRACRERVSPADVGLQWLGPRRVAGPRYEEVALLACIRANCYLRLQRARIGIQQVLSRSRGHCGWTLPRPCDRRHTCWRWAGRRPATVPGW